MFKIREIERKDLETIRKWHNDTELYQKLGGTFHYCNDEVESAWFDNYMQSRNKNVRCVITDENDELLGCIYLLNIDYINRSAELGIITDISNRRKGVATFANNSIFEHAFNNLNLKRLEIEILSTNSASIALAKKAGFKQEGIKRKAYYKNGDYVDAILLSILKEEYLEEKAKQKELPTE